MPRKEGPEPPKRGSLRWDLMRREKFVWEAGDIELVHEGKRREESPGRGLDSAREDDGNPNAGRR
jgi:hypothetical protein